MGKRTKKNPDVIEWEGNEYPADKYRVHHGQLYSELSGEPANLQRAEWANTAVSAFVNEVGENDDYTDLKDLLGNLMHWADRQGVDFGGALAGGSHHYMEEVRQEGGEPVDHIQGGASYVVDPSDIPPTVLLSALQSAADLLEGITANENSEPDAMAQGLFVAGEVAGAIRFTLANHKLPSPAPMWIACAHGGDGDLWNGLGANADEAKESLWSELITCQMVADGADGYKSLTDFEKNSEYYVTTFQLMPDRS